ncbi:MAG TPA: hypothetical protein VJG90_06500 [Candidatus Nanoarchaeia archaeon]|nr:hypothetical protein [Candidatus Nanoarchaeia archaeon]
MIRYKRPDEKDALSRVQAAEKEMRFTLSLKPTEESGSTIVRNIYECFRMLGGALLVIKGIEAEDHIAPIQELLKLQVPTERPIRLIDNLRKLRHQINYRGYRPSLAEVDDAISLAKNCFQPLLKEVQKRIKS